MNLIVISLKDKFNNFLGNKKKVFELLVVIFFLSFFIKYLGIPDKYDIYIYIILFILFLFFLTSLIKLILKELSVILKERKDEK
ncbi:membrane protein [sediment metagenome]|uniref:Membrane protein n=1 Tax=sediment metagenome TaxID=749907 RepID=D9PMJ9_9ZZZZ